MWSKRLRVTLGMVSAMTVAAPVWAVQPGGFAGIDLGVSEPTNDNYRANVQTGATGSPFLGYMFDKYIGLQTNFHFTSQPPDNDGRHGKCVVDNGQTICQDGLGDENAWTTTLAWTAGPRLNIPLGDMFDLYGTVQGGGFKGVHGRLNQWAPGFLAGGGLDFNVTEQVSLGLFGRYNRAYMAPHPTYLIGQDSSQQGPEDIQFFTGGVSMKYSFNEPAKPLPPPPPPPPPPAAAPPMKKKIVLRAVYFDTDKSNIRADARPVLDEAAQLLKDEGTASIVAEGHTDSRGSDAYNMGLSRRRADSVKKYLVDHGVAASRISTEGFGESKPVATNATADGRQQNRRVELRLK